VEQIELPDTNSPEVMEQAISLFLTNILWEQSSRMISPDDMEVNLLAVYGRVFKAVHAAHTVN